MQDHTKLVHLKVHANHLSPLLGHTHLGGSVLCKCINNSIPLSRDSPKLDSHPFLRIPLDLLQKRLPQVPILDVTPRPAPFALLPVVPNPRPRPLGRTLDDVLRVCGDDKGPEPLAGPETETQGGDDGAQLRPIAGLHAVVAERTLLFEAV